MSRAPISRRKWSYRVDYRKPVGRLSVLSAFVLFAAMSLRGQQVSQVSVSSVHPIDRKDFTNPDQYTFLGPILKDVEVVSLGESIHRTHEFPLVRLGIVRYLNESVGFHLLVMEGSALDVWVAQDRLLNSARSAEDCKRALGGFFGLWNTSEMERVIEYEAESWHSSHPLYIVGYDIQAGNGHGSSGSDVFKQLLESLRTYAPPPEGFATSQWMRNIEPIVTDYRSEDHASVAAAIQILDEWIKRAAPQVEKRFPDVPHATALRLIPDNLRAVLQFHDSIALHQTPQVYQEQRDINAASYVLEVKKTAAGEKLMLWAHMSHLRNDNGQGLASVGGILHRSLGPRLYTITLFAESGGAILIFPGNNNEDLGYGRVHGSRGDLGQLLSRLSGQDYFLDLRSLPAGPSANSVFWTSQPVWSESGGGRSVLAQDQDGIFWIKTVHAPDFTPFVLMVSLIHYRTLLMVTGICLVMLIVVLPICVLVRSQRRRRMPLPQAL
jgi:erythromycin esterase-like protein